MKKTGVESHWECYLSQLTWLEWVFAYWGGVAILWQGVFLTGASYADGRLLMWVALVGFAGLILYLFGFRKGKVAIVGAGRIRWILIGLGALVMVLYWLTFYPNHDDATYMRRGMDYQLHPQVPLQEISGEPGVRSYRNQRMMGTYDILRTTVSDGTPIPYLVSYYLVFPGLLAYLIPWVLYRFARVVFLSKEKEALILSVIGVAFLSLWIDVLPGHSMTFLHMGKDVFGFLVVPLLLIGLLQHSRRPSCQTGGIVTLLFGLALGVQVSGLAVALLILAFFGLGWFFAKSGQCLRTISYLLPLACYLLLASFVVKSGGKVDSWWPHSDQSAKTQTHSADSIERGSELSVKGRVAVESSRGQTIKEAFLFESDLAKSSRGSSNKRSRLLGVYGEGWFGTVALLSLFMYLLLAGRDPFYYYTVLFLLLLLFPFSGYLMAELSGYEDFFWRWTWMMPSLPVVSWAIWSSLVFLARKERSRAIFLSVAFSLLFIFTGESRWKGIFATNEWHKNNLLNWIEIEPPSSWEDQGLLQEVQIEGYSIYYKGVRF